MIAITIAGISYVQAGDSVLVRYDGSIAVLENKNLTQVVSPTPQPKAEYRLVNEERVVNAIDRQFDRRFGYKSQAEVTARWEKVD